MLRLDDLLLIRRSWRNRAVLSIGPADEPQCQANILERAGNRPTRREHPIQPGPSGKVRNVAMLGYKPEGRFEPVNAAEM